jgi:hypothetical protein
MARASELNGFRFSGNQAWQRSDVELRKAGRYRRMDNPLSTTRSFYVADKMVILDARSRTADRKRWQYLGRFGESASYSGVSEDAARLLDRVLDDMCQRRNDRTRQFPIGGITGQWRPARGGERGSGRAPGAASTARERTSLSAALFPRVIGSGQSNRDPGVREGFAHRNRQQDRKKHRRRWASAGKTVAGAAPHPGPEIKRLGSRT